MTKEKPDENLDLRDPAKDESTPIWGIEVEFQDRSKKSVFHSAKKVILDGDYVQVQLLDSKYVAYPLIDVRKVLSVRARSLSGYTGKELKADGPY